MKDTAAITFLTRLSKSVNGLKHAIREGRVEEGRKQLIELADVLEEARGTIGQVALQLLRGGEVKVVQDEADEE